MVGHGEQLHDVVVVDGGGGEEDEFKVQLVDLGSRLAGAAGLALLLQLAGGLDVGALEGTVIIGGKGGFDGGFLLGLEIGVLVELGLEALDLLKSFDELGACGVALELGHVLGLAAEALRLHEVVELVDGGVELLDHGGRGIDEPDFLRAVGLLAGEELDRLVDGILLLAEVENVAVRLGVVEHAVGAGEGLDEAVVFQLLIDVEGVEVFRVEAGEEHVDDDSDVDLVRLGFGRGLAEVGQWESLRFDAVLHVLIVGVEIAEAMVGAEAVVVVGEDGFERLFLFVGLFLVVLQLLREVFLELLDVGIALGGRGEDAGDIQGAEVGIGSLIPGLHGLEEIEVGDGVVDRGGGENGVELTAGGNLVVASQDGVDDGLFCDGLTGLGRGFIVADLGLEVVDVELEDVFILNGVGDGVFVQRLLKDVLGGLVAGLFAIDLLDGGVLLKDGGAGKAEELGIWEEVFDRLVVLAELGAVALVEDDGDALFRDGGEQFLVGLLLALLAAGVALAGLIEGEAELLNGGDDDLVGIVGGEESVDQRVGVGIFLYAVFLESVKLLAGLAVEVLAVDDEEAFVDVGIVLEEGGGFEGGEGLARSGGVPDIAVAGVLVNAIDDVFGRVDLIGTHHHQLLLTGDEHHVAADHVAEGALRQELLGEAVEVGDLVVLPVGVLIDGEEELLRIESEVAEIVVGEVVGVRPVADDEELHKREQRVRVAIAGVLLVVDDLLHGAARTDFEGLQLDLCAGDAVDEQNDVVAVEAAAGVDAQLADDLVVVFAPVLDVD